MALLSVLFSLLVLAPRIGDPVIEYDEQFWILSSEYFADLVRAGDLTSSKWEPTNLGDFGSINPHLGRVFIAASQYFVPAEARAHYDPRLIDALSWEKTHPVTPRVLDLRAIRAARWATAIGASVCTALAALLIESLVGITGALAFLALQVANPAYRNVFSHVFTDSYALTFQLLMTIAAVRIATAENLRQNRRWYVVFALATACAFNVKATALVFGSLLTVAILGWRWLRRAPMPVLPCVVTLTSAMLLSCALNPYLWPTAARPHDQNYEAVLPISRATLQVDRSPVTGKAPVWLRLAEMHVRWRRAISAVAHYHSASRTTKPLIAKRIVYSQNGHSAGLIALGWTIASTGLLIRKSQKGEVSLAERRIAAVLGVAAVYCAWAVVMIPMDWERYYLPAVFHLQLAECCTLGWLLTYLSAMLREKPPVPSTKLA